MKAKLSTIVLILTVLFAASGISWGCGGYDPPPVCYLISPLDGAIFTEGATITIDANATDNGSISKVEFYKDGTILLNTDTNKPYSYPWNNVPAGIYKLKAVAYDNYNQQGSSNEVTICVGIKRVDIDAPGPVHDGNSWESAYNYLRDALAAASSGEIWVAKGTYRPDQNSVDPNGNNLRTETFQLKAGVRVYGGFKGNETSRAQRNLTTNKTTLSGDIGTPDNDSDNSYHVVTGGSGIDSTTVLDGFVITRGHGKDDSSVDSKGAGIYCNSASPKIANCTITDNKTGSSGDGGGMYNYYSGPTVTNCTFSYNYAAGTSSGNKGGGGMFNDYSSPNVTNCAFFGNHTDYCGGGMNNYHSSPTVVSCVFAGNYCNSYGGGMENYPNSNPTITNCTFYGNFAAYGGGAMSNDSSAQIIITNCIFWENWDSQINNVSKTTLNYSDFEGGWYGTGTGNISDDPNFMNAVSPWGPDGQFGTWDDCLGVDGSDGVFGTWDDGLRIMAYSPCVDKADGSKAPASDITGRGRVDVPYKPNRDAFCADIGAYESPTVWFVNDDGPDDNGSSWNKAFKYLQNALAVAKDGNEIWVAEGIYKPDHNSVYPNGSGLRTETFQLKAGVNVYGGFAGQITGPQIKNWTSYNNTILSGDINTPGDNNDNSYNVVTGADNAKLDGFTITAGNSRGYGGGICCDGTAPSVSNCVIRNNKARGGAGMYNYNYNNGSQTITNCFFIGNTGTSAVYNKYSSPTLTNCVFTGNERAVANGGTASPALINCTFSGNGTETSYGGAMSNAGGAAPTITNCIFWGDYGYYSEGDYDYREMDNRGNSLNPIISFCNIRGCGGSGDSWDYYFGSDGGGNIDSDPVFLEAGTPAGWDGVFGTVDDGLRVLVISPCVDAADGNAAPLTDILGSARADINAVTNIGIGDPNYADMGAYEYTTCVYVYNTTQKKPYSTIEAAINDACDNDYIKVYPGTHHENISFGGKAITLASIDPNDPNVVAATIIDDNSRDYYIVIFDHSENSDSVITGFTIAKGKSGEINCDGASPTISNCVVTGDYYEDWQGWGIWCFDGAAPTITNCTITGNYDVGIYCLLNSSPAITNCKIIDNTGEGIYCNGASPVITNCTISNNAGGSVESRSSSTAEYRAISIDGCVIENNGKGLYIQDAQAGPSVAIKGCKIISNSGDGIYLYLYDRVATISNCIIAKNSHDGLYASNGACKTITNCTITGNHSYGVDTRSTGLPNIVNSILWNNTGGELYGNCAAIYSCVKNGVSGVGNFNIDPCFVNTDSNDFHLRVDSMCIDAGAPWFDYSNEPLPNGGRINVGAYGNTPEATETTDADGDGISDNWERHYWPSDDPNQHDPNDDLDGDGFSNRIEYLFGYNPAAYTSKPIELVVSISSSQLDPTNNEVVTVGYMVNKNANVDVNFVNSYTGQIVRTISQTAAAGEVKQAVWNGIGSDGKIIERYFYDVVISAVGGGGSCYWRSANLGYAGDEIGTIDYKVDVSNFNPYKNIPVIIRCDMPDWCTRKINVVEKDHWPADDNDRICRVINNILLRPGWNTFYWYGLWDIEPNTGQVCQKAYDVYYDVPHVLKKGVVLVYYDYILSNLRCNPYRISPLADEVTTMTYDLAYDANVTVDTYDPDGNYFGSLSKQQSAGLQREFIWYGETKDPNAPDSRYISKEGVYRIEIKCDKTDEKLDGSITVYK